MQVLIGSTYAIVKAASTHSNMQFMRHIASFCSCNSCCHI